MSFSTSTSGAMYRAGKMISSATRSNLAQAAADLLAAGPLGGLGGGALPIAVATLAGIGEDMLVSQIKREGGNAILHKEGVRKRKKADPEDPTPPPGANPEPPPPDGGGHYPLGRIGRKSCTCDKHYRIRVTSALQERMYMVNGPAIGDDYYNRDGRHVVGESLSIAAIIKPNAASGVAWPVVQMIRFMVVCQKNPTAATLLGNDGIRYLTEAAADYNTAVLADIARHVVGTNFVVLFDDWVKVPISYSAVGLNSFDQAAVTMSIDLENLAIRYAGAGGNANCTNAIYFGYVCSDTTHSVEMYSDFYFKG